MNTKYIYLFTTLLLFFACGGGDPTNDLSKILKEGDLEALKTEKAALQKQADELNKNIAQLDKAIFAKSGKNTNYTLVKTKEVTDTTFAHYIKFQANIETEQDVRVSPEYSGVIRLNVREGQYVGKGALIGSIDEGGLREQLNQAQIMVDQAISSKQNVKIQSDLAKVTFQKRKRLWDQKIGSEIQYLQAKTNYESSVKQIRVAEQQIAAARKGVQSVQQQLKKTKLYAPFSGVVEEIITESGQVVGPGVPVIRLVNPSSVKAIAEVPENYLAQITTGTRARVSLPALNRVMETKINRVGTTINPNNRSFTVEVPLRNVDGKVKPNLNAEISLNDYTAEGAILIPDGVIMEDGKGSYVFVRKGDAAAKQYVTVETTTNGLAQIAEGLSVGDELITEGVNRLQDGSKIKTL